MMLVIFILMGVGFFTLFERKILGYLQFRKGPNKVGIFGVFQPFSDGLKLFSKEQVIPLMSNYFLYYFSPVFGLFISLLIWVCLPFFSGFVFFFLSVLFFLCCSSLSVYFVMLAGWSSNSNYSLFGSLRCVAQTISYEVCLALILLTYIFLVFSFNLIDFYFFQYYIWFIFLGFPLGIIFFSCFLAETNRLPFDFAEGESELVSGFNVEYSGGGFSLIFLAEYSSVLFMSFLFSFCFMGGNLFSWLFYLEVLFLVYFFIWIRATLPRFRYDKLMYLSWKTFLPSSLNFFFFFFCFGLFMITCII
uniref:NADH-ubiquinone oxidoreductase chain 1 n=1 Tax=Iberobaenia minuta TaxID=1857294 RepID=A0A3G1HJR6_9COLE|nr:NADH deshydrogenase subunit 1 [Iberobaenia minuta]